MFVLKKKQYTWLDMYRIPFSCAPGSTVAVTVQKAVTALVNIFQVIVVAKFLDGMLAAVSERSFDGELALWFVLMLLMVSWKRVSYHIGLIFTNYLVIQGNRQILSELTEKRSRLEYYLCEDPPTEELINRITNRMENNINEMLQRFLNFFVIYIPRIVGVLLIIAAHVWWLAIVVMVMTVPLIFLSLRGGQKIYSANKEAAVYERRHKYLFDVLTGRETVEERSLFGYTPHVNEQWHSQFESARKINMKAQAVFIASMQGGSMVTSLLASMICLIMVPLTASGALSVGIFISLCTAIYDLVNLMGWEMTSAVSQIAKFKEYMKDLTAFAALPERNTEQGSTVPEGTMPEGKVPEGAGAAAQELEERIPEFERLELKNVTFHYPGSEANILNGFSMVLEKGRHYAIVGENGAGKSTLIKLLTGFYRDYQGEILYNGVEMRKFSQKEWFRIFSCVFQDFARYYLSVEENIALGNIALGNTALGNAALGSGGMEPPAAKPEQIKGNGQEEESRWTVTPQMSERMRQVAQKLGIHEAISSLKYGYATRLGKLDEDSADLSGGQWQRIAMGRALMNDAPVLLLDEPTAALDPLSESALYEKFGEISRGRTTIFISHRLGSTKLSDHIYVLKDGRAAEQGTHEELLEKQGVYAAMYETQQSWYTKEEGEGA